SMGRAPTGPTQQRGIAMTMIVQPITGADESDWQKSKIIYPGDWLRFRDAADFSTFYGNTHPLPERCGGLHDSHCKADLESYLDTLACGRALAHEPDGFYYHRTRN